MRYLFLLIAILFGKALLAQLDNSSLFFNQNKDSIYENTAYLKIQNLNYMRNNEYYGPIADGYTLFGVQLMPQLGYQVSKNLGVEAGIFLEKDFGNKDFNYVLPTFTLRYTKNDFKMLFGNIDGSLNHQLIEPIYNFERVITNRLENGAQFMVNKKRFDFDAWVDWQHMIYKGASGNERIWGGLSSNLFKFGNDRFTFKIPLQVTVLHNGGQIDTTNTPSSTNWNMDGGVVLNYNTDHKFFQKFIVDARYVARVSYLFSPAESETQGDGLLANIGFNTPLVDVLVSYWYGHNFVTDFGGYLYSSQSSTVFYANTYESSRSLVFLRLTKKIELAKNVMLTLRLEPYYDLLLKRLEYSYGFYINLDQRIWFRKGQK